MVRESSFLFVLSLSTLLSVCCFVVAIAFRKYLLCINERRLSYHTEDTRFTRFSDGKALSEQLYKECGNLYYMRNGKQFELVITKPVRHMYLTLGALKGYL